MLLLVAEQNWELGLRGMEMRVRQFYLSENGISEYGTS